MNGDRCPTCDGALTEGRCLRCDARGLARFVNRELAVLGVLTAVTIAGFFLTRAAAAANAEMHRRDAAAWFERAQTVEIGDAAARVAALRRAVSNAPDSRRYRLALAGALLAGGQTDEARRVLEALRDVGRDDAEINLQLARLEASHAPVASRRYYQSALAALWQPEQQEFRRRVRVELVEFLLARDERARALSELLVMMADLPDTPEAQTQAGNLFLRAGDPQRALTHFTRALTMESQRADALAGAGAAAFELGDYPRARRYLTSAPPNEGRTSTLLTLTRLVLDRDPLAPRIGAAERRRRMTSILEQATAALDACLSAASPDSAPPLHALQAEAAAFTAGSAAAARRDLGDFVDDGLALASRIESAVDERCRHVATPFDRAILLIVRRRGIGPP